MLCIIAAGWPGVIVNGFCQSGIGLPNPDTVGALVNQVSLRGAETRKRTADQPRGRCVGVIEGGGPDTDRCGSRIGLDICSSTAPNEWGSLSGEGEEGRHVTGGAEERQVWAWNKQQGVWPWSCTSSEAHRTAMPPARLGQMRCTLVSDSPLPVHIRHYPCSSPGSQYLAPGPVRPFPSCGEARPFERPRSDSMYSTVTRKMGSGRSHAHESRDQTQSYCRQRT